MKNLKAMTVASIMAVMSSGSVAMAHGYHDGFVDGIIAATAVTFALFVTHETHHHKELVYIGAADDAAAFIQNGGEPSALLREALETERGFLIQAGYREAQDFSDATLAELVVSRATQLNQ